MRFLNFASMRYSVIEATKQMVAAAVADIQPDVAFLLWPHDSHTDHEVASQLAKIALRHGDRLLPPGTRYKYPQRIYQFDNGPRHTVGFEPDTFVDITTSGDKRASGWAASWPTFAAKSTIQTSTKRLSGPKKRSPLTAARRAVSATPKHSTRATPTCKRFFDGGRT
jgi:LmbE family N-acetylglucosaminyl deacetylase